MSLSRKEIEKNDVRIYSFICGKSDSPRRPVYDLRRAEQRRPAEEPQGAPDVGDHVYDRDRGRQHDLERGLLLHVHSDQAHIVQEGLRSGII